MLEPIQAQPLGLLVLLATSAFRFTSRSVGSFNIVGFPIYDTHGNMVATIARYGTNSYQLNNLRSYDAWGVIRYGALSGDPKNRYCAASGHQCDDESGLIYMRARYYDASSGRLISEDPKHSGANWFAYCNSCPTDRIDPSGKDDLAEFLTSEGLSSELEELGVGTLDGTIDQVGSELMVEVDMFEGQPGCTVAAMNLIRQWAVGNGVSAIFIQGVVGSAEGRGATMMALMAIKMFGDSGGKFSQQDSVFTQLYWLLDGSG